MENEQQIIKNRKSNRVLQCLLKVTKLLTVMGLGASILFNILYYEEINAVYKLLEPRFYSMTGFSKAEQILAHITPLGGTKLQYISMVLVWDSAIYLDRYIKIENNSEPERKKEAIEKLQKECAVYDEVAQVNSSLYMVQAFADVKSIASQFTSRNSLTDYVRMKEQTDFSMKRLQDFCNVASVYSYCELLSLCSIVIWEYSKIIQLFADLIQKKKQKKVDMLETERCESDV